MDPLTVPEDWDEVWRPVRVPARVGTRSAFDRSFVGLLERYRSELTGAHVVEVGCAPGRWMVHLAETYGARVTGWEYAPLGVARTRANLDACGVAGDVVEADFLTDELPIDVADVVLSLGFVEHFDDPVPVVARHATLLRPGGLLVCEVPNLAGPYRLLLQRRTPEVLAGHNLAVMTPRALTAVGRVLGLEVVDRGWLGGPEPDHLPTPEGDLARRIHGLARRGRRRLRVFDRWSPPWVSGYAYVVFRHPGGAEATPATAAKASAIASTE